MEITVRLATQDDFPSILSLIREFALFQRTPEKVAITIDEMIEQKELFKCLVAETSSHEIVAFASFFFAYFSWTGKALYLDDLFVKEQYRANGIGLQLFQVILDYAKKEKCKRLRWQVSKWNTGAIGFYKSMGATIDNEEINCNMNVNSGEISV